MAAYDKRRTVKTRSMDERRRTRWRPAARWIDRQAAEGTCWCASLLLLIRRKTPTISARMRAAPPTPPCSRSVLRCLYNCSLGVARTSPSIIRRNASCASWHTCTSRAPHVQTHRCGCGGWNGVGRFAARRGRLMVDFVSPPRATAHQNRRDFFPAGSPTALLV